MTDALFSTDSSKKKEVSLHNSDLSIQTFFYVGMRNNLELSGIADKKANILFSLSALVISIAIITYSLHTNLHNRMSILIPFLVLIAFNVATIFLAIFVTMPKYNTAKSKQNENVKNSTNLAFFGGFTKLRYTEFQKELKEMFKEKVDINAMHTIDLYYSGIVLHKKYVKLRNAYTLFIMGIISFAISFVFVII